MARTRETASNDDPARSRGRISLPLTPDGTGFDFDQMRATTRERLCDLMETNAADIYKAAGRPVPGDEPDAGGPDLFGGITLENIRSGLDLLSQANVLAVRMFAPRFVKHPFKRDPKTGKSLPLVIDSDILARCFALTDAQHAELDPRALRLAKKYSGRMPVWMKEHLDLIMLLGMYAKYTGENALTAIQTQVQRDLKLAQERAAQVAKPKPVDTDRVRIMEDEPGLHVDPVYPPPVTGNGGVETQL